MPDDRGERERRLRRSWVGLFALAQAWPIALNRINGAVWVYGWFCLWVLAATLTVAARAVSADRRADRG